MAFASRRHRLWRALRHGAMYVIEATGSGYQVTGTDAAHGQWVA